jgi:hypothetical protein
MANSLHLANYFRIIVRAHKQIWHWAGVADDAFGRVKLLLAAAFLVIGGLVAIWWFAVRRYGLVGTAILIVAALAMVAGAALVGYIVYKRHARDALRSTATAPDLDTPEAREGKRILSTIRPHSLAETKATEAARPHAEALLRVAQRDPLSESQRAEADALVSAIDEIRPRLVKQQLKDKRSGLPFGSAVGKEALAIHDRFAALADAYYITDEERLTLDIITALERAIHTPTPRLITALDNNRRTLQLMLMHGARPLT